MQWRDKQRDLLRFEVIELATHAPKTCSTHPVEGAWHGPLCMRGTTKWCTNRTTIKCACIWLCNAVWHLPSDYICTYVIRMSNPYRGCAYVSVCENMFGNRRCSYLCNWPTKLARVRSTEKLKLKSKLHFVRHQFYSLLDSPLFLHTIWVHFDSSLCTGMPKLRL